MPQFYGLFCGAGRPQSHAEAVDRANAIRAKRGLPPLGDTLPPVLTPEMAEANMARAAAMRGARVLTEGRGRG